MTILEEILKEGDQLLNDIFTDYCSSMSHSEIGNRLKNKIIEPLNNFIVQYAKTTDNNFLACFQSLSLKLDNLSEEKEQDPQVVEVLMKVIDNILDRLHN